MVRLAEWMSELGNRVTILALNRSIKRFYEVPSGVGYRVAPPEVLNSCRWYRLDCLRQQSTAISKFILDTDPELVISFIDTTNVKVLMAMHSSKIPVIVSERTDPRNHQIRWRWSLLRRLYYPMASRVVLVTKETFYWANALWPKWDACVIPNAALSPVMLQPCERPRWFSVKNLVAMGRLDKWKGFDHLLQAFSRVAGDFPDWNLTIMGEGVERSNLENLISSLGLKGRVYLPGLISSPAEILSQADLFVHSSLYEGFPNAIVEAMACGLPAISFDCPSGPKEIIRNNIDGILVPVGDMPALSKAMLKLMADDPERKRLASRAPDVLERFSQERIFGMWQAIINDVVSTKTLF